MVQTKVRSIDGDGHVIENIPQLWNTWRRRTVAGTAAVGGALLL